MVRGALLLLVCACHRDPEPPPPPEQTERAALAVLCTPGGDPERVTNKHMRGVVDSFVDKHPWDIEEQILQAARDAGLVDCHPLDALTSIRARNGVDVPRLADARGTVPVDAGRTFAITRAGITIEGVGDVQLDDVSKYTPLVDGPIAARVAIDRAINFHTFAPIYDGFRRAGVHDIELLVTAPTQTRAVVLVAPRSSEPVRTTAVIAVGATITLAGKAMTPDELRAAFVTPPDRVAILAEPEVPMQRLADVIAMIGGRATLGVAWMPVESPAPP